MKKIQIVFAAGIMMFCLACKKESKTSNTDLITSGNWKLSAITVNPGYDYNGDGTIDTDIYALYEPCEKDDYYTFKKNGTMEINEGSSKCDPSSPQVSTVDWQFANNEKSIIIDGEQATIVEISANRLQLKYDDYGETTNVTMVK
jgi:hypothetical protein